jgi:uncharacterized membrane protein YraQ (UPF0718 family)
MAAFIAASFYATMVIAGYAVELIFKLLHLVPSQRNASVMEAHISWNYTTWLNIAFLLLAALLLVRFFTSGGLPMLRMMGGSPATADDHDHHDHRGETGHPHTSAT